jgi:hypothetical protein
VCRRGGDLTETAEHRRRPRCCLLLPAAARQFLSCLLSSRVLCASLIAVRACGPARAPDAVFFLKKRKKIFFFENKNKNDHEG